MEDDKKGAAVSFPPPLIFICFIGLGVTVNHFIPLAFLPLALTAFVSKVGAFIAFLIGVLLAVSAVLKLHFARTSIEPWKPTTEIVETGVFKYSRNPIYLSFDFLGVTAALYFNNLWILLSLVPATFLIAKLVIAKEEAYLVSKFGDQYLAYCAKVGRWWGVNKS